MKKHLTRLYIVRNNGTTGTYISNDPAPALRAGNKEPGIRKLEQNILARSEFGKWEVAYIYDAALPYGSAPILSYHNLRGTERLSKEQAEELRLYHKKQFGQYRAYIIPTIEQQNRGTKPRVAYVQEPEDVRSFINDSVHKIQVYDAKNMLVKTFFANPVEEYYLPD